MRIKSVEQTAKMASGGLDHLVANAAYVSTYDASDPLGML